MTPGARLGFSYANSVYYTVQSLYNNVDACLLHRSNSILQRVITRVADWVAIFVFAHEAVSQDEADDAVLPAPSTDRWSFEGCKPSGQPRASWRKIQLLDGTMLATLAGISCQDSYQW